MEQLAQTREESRFAGLDAPKKINATFFTHFKIQLSKC